jgi:uncharacterized protein YjaG (DUF416 family)
LNEIRPCKRLYCQVVEFVLTGVYNRVVEKMIHHYEIYLVQVVKFVFDLNLFVLEVQCPKTNNFTIEKKNFEISQLTAIVI